MLPSDKYGKKLKQTDGRNYGIKICNMSVEIVRNELNWNSKKRFYFISLANHFLLIIVGNQHIGDNINKWPTSLTLNPAYKCYNTLKVKDTIESLQKEELRWFFQIQWL